MANCLHKLDLILFVLSLQGGYVITQITDETLIRKIVVKYLSQGHKAKECQWQY